MSTSEARQQAKGSQTTKTRSGAQTSKGKEVARRASSKPARSPDAIERDPTPIFSEVMELRHRAWRGKGGKKTDPPPLFGVPAVPTPNLGIDELVAKFYHRSGDAPV